MRLIRFLTLAVFALVLCLPVFSQESSDWYYGKKIRSIEFNGLNNLTSLEMDGVVSSYIGKEFSDDLYFDLLNRIFSLEFFDDITSDAVPGDSKGESVVIKFTVKEKPFISSIKFTGNRHIGLSELKQAISIKERDIFNSSKVLLDERAIRDAYLKKGYTNVRVSSSTEESSDGGINLVFKVSEGRPTVLKTVSFMGNQVVASKTLKGLLSMKEAGLISKGSFQESQLEADKMAILSYYQNRGYVDVAIIDVVRNVTYNEKEDCDELDLQFVIQEGPQYTFSGIKFAGNNIFPTEKLRELIRLQDGEVFNQERFQEGVYAITDLYYENGYTSNGFDPAVSKDPETRQISITFSIVERPRSHIENIILRGNTRTKDYVILRELPLETGDIFSKAKITAGLRNLYNLQFFSAIVPDIVGGSEENLVDLIINVEEQSTTSVEFGLTFSGLADPDALPVSLFLKWQNSNFMGTGKSISTTAELSTDTQSLSFGYADSWLWGMPVSVDVSAGLEHSSLSTPRIMYLPDGSVTDSKYYMNYEQMSLDLSASIGRRWIPNFAIFSLTGGITGEILNNLYDADLYIPADTTISDYHENWGMQNSIWASGSVDARDLSYDPSSGWFASQRLSWTGLLPFVENEFFFRSDTKGEIYFTLLDTPITDTWNLKFVLAGLSTFSFIEPTPGTTLSSTNKLYVDGMFTGRGWESIYNTHRTKCMWNNAIELRMPLVPGVVSLDFFFDAVALKEDVKDMFSSLSIEDFYFSFGPGFRVSLQQFPLRILLANTFQIKDGAVKWQNGTGPEWKFVLSFNITNR